MGWCSATDIMDAATQAAEALAARVYEVADAENPGDRSPSTLAEAIERRPELRAELDDVLRPFVRTIAAKLHDGDWDCVDEAEAFDRFPQEMYDHDDQEHAAWLRDRIRDSDEVHEFEKWTAALRAHTDKMKAGNS